MHIDVCWSNHYSSLRQGEQLQQPLVQTSHLFSGQPHCRPCRRQTRICVASTGSPALLDRPAQHEHHKSQRLKVLPRIQYSTNVQHIDCEELLQLMDTAGLAFDKCNAPDEISDDCSLADKAERLQKLQHAIEKSMTVVIALVMEDKLPSYNEPHEKHSPSSTDDWSWVTARRQRKKRKVMAGFARATGDGALTATIHDLVVLPELQGLGLGRKLLAKATIQVRNRTGTTDIGLASDPASYGFFSRCGFDLDREQSTFMTFVKGKCQVDVSHQLQSKPSLLELLAKVAALD